MLPYRLSSINGTQFPNVAFWFLVFTEMCKWTSPTITARLNIFSICSFGGGRGYWTWFRQQNPLLPQKKLHNHLLLTTVYKISSFFLFQCLSRFSFQKCTHRHLCAIECGNDCWSTYLVMLLLAPLWLGLYLLCTSLLTKCIGQMNRS